MKLKSERSHISIKIDQTDSLRNEAKGNWTVLTIYEPLTAVCQEIETNLK